MLPSRAEPQGLIWSAHISWLFVELPYLQRVGAARAAGFQCIETAWPQDGEREALPALVAEHGVKVALLNCNAGDVEAGERGFLNDRSRRAELERDFIAACELAQQIGAPRLNLLVGCALADAPVARQRQEVVAALRELAEEARGRRLRIVLEPLNEDENPGYLLASPDAAAEAIESCGSDAVGLLLDVYHAARAGFDPLLAIERHAALIEHVQIADFPGRGAPGSGSLALWPILEALQAAGYEGAVGLEFSSGETGVQAFDFLHDARSPVRLA